MKILVISDIHRNRSGLKRVIEDNPDANEIIFLGDGEDDTDEIEYMLPQMRAMRKVMVRGNCDIFSMLKPVQIEEIGELRLMCTHGHAYYVKEGYDRIIRAAKEEKVNMVLFGHTHRHVIFEKEGTTFFNPGALMDGRYGIISIKEGRAECVHCRI